MCSIDIYIYIYVAYNMKKIFQLVYLFKTTKLVCHLGSKNKNKYNILYIGWYDNVKRTLYTISSPPINGNNRIIKN